MADETVIQWLNSARIKYLQVRTFLEIEEASNPPKPNQVFEPYKDKYKGKLVLTELLEELKGLNTPDSKLSDRLKIVEGLVQFELGLVSCEVQELTAGEEHYVKALECIAGDGVDVETCLLLISIQNQLGILWSERGEIEKAKGFLNRAESIYAQFKQQGDETPFSLVELLKWPNTSRENDNIDGGFGKAHVHTLYYLAQVYKGLDEAKLAAAYCHKTLKWQIDQNSFNPLEWSLNCATLSTFFVARDKFPIARYLLSCASYTMDNPGEIEMGTEEEVELFNRTKADVARCWANYGIALLNSSREKLMDEEKGTDDMEALMQSLRTDCNLEDLILIDPDKVKSYCELITDKYVLDYQDARKAFLSSQKWINESKEFYTLHEWASDHVVVVQSNSKLFDHLAFFEPEDDRKCKMLKRRIDMLDKLLNSLSQKYYLNQCQQLLFELGETRSQLMHLKLALYDPKKPRNQRAVKKINSLVEKGIENFQSFLTSLKTNDKHPDKYPDNFVRPALLARFYLGQLNSKFIVFMDPARRLSNLNEIEKNYKYVKSYVELNPDHESCIAAELAVFKEMVDLIPARLQQDMSATLY